MPSLQRRAFLRERAAAAKSAAGAGVLLRCTLSSETRREILLLVMLRGKGRGREMKGAPERPVN